MRKNNIYLILFMMLVTASCQTLKNAVSGVKQENSDEFLVQKKNPLVLPPDFTDLPEPFEESNKVTEVQIEECINKANLNPEDQYMVGKYIYPDSDIINIRIGQS